MSVTPPWVDEECNFSRNSSSLLIKYYSPSGLRADDDCESFRLQAVGSAFKQDVVVEINSLFQAEWSQVVAKEKTASGISFGRRFFVSFHVDHQLMGKLASL
jgi:hypothetical protein